MSNKFHRLVIVPSDPISAYERAGYSGWLQGYYNPGGLFNEVFALSPLETGERSAYGMTILGVKNNDFSASLRRLRPNIVRAYGGYWPSDLVSSNRVQNAPVVVSVHDTNPSNIHRSLRYSDLVICMSSAILERVQSLGVASKRIRVMPNRIDRTIFFPRSDPEFLAEFNRRFPYRKRILHVGRKAAQKNLETLIASLAHLPEDYCAIFVGLGDAEPFKRLAKETRVANRCYWVESVRNSDLPNWYSACACMATPSRWEGFGIVFIEAAACGVPIVTSDIAPMNEYLVKDVSAALVKEYNDPLQLAFAIERVCEDSAYRNRITTGALAVARKFDKIAVDQLEMQIYREALLMPPLSFARKISIFGWRAKKIAEKQLTKWEPRRGT